MPLDIMAIMSHDQLQMVLHFKWENKTIGE